MVVNDRHNLSQDENLPSIFVPIFLNFISP